MRSDSNQTKLLGAFLGGVIAATAAAYFVVHHRPATVAGEDRAGIVAAPVDSPDATSVAAPGSVTVPGAQPQTPSGAAQSSTHADIHATNASYRPTAANSSDARNLATAGQNAMPQPAPALASVGATSGGAAPGNSPGQQPSQTQQTEPAQPQPQLQAQAAQSQAPQPQNPQAKEENWTRMVPSPPAATESARPAVLTPAAPATSPPLQQNTVTIPDGTLITIRLSEALTSQRNKSGDEFMATLDQPLVVDGFVIAERGARVEGRVIESDQTVRAKGLAHLTLELTRVHTSDGQRLAVRTGQYMKKAEEDKGGEVAKVGAGAVLGAIIGAAAGGGKGAGIGAAAGGAAGAGTVAATRGKPAALPIETRLDFRLLQPVTITEQRR